MAEPNPFDLSDRIVDELVALDPILATQIGVPGFDHLWPDLGPDGMEAARELVDRHRPTMAAHLDHPDRWQRLAATVADAYLGELASAHDSDDVLYDVSHLASTFEMLRSVFDLMDTATEEGWEAIHTRLVTIGGAYAGYRAKLELAIDRGKVAAIRQARSVIAQSRELAGRDSAYFGLIERAREAGFAGWAERLVPAIDVARMEAGAFADFLEGSYLPVAPEADGVGAERYLRAAERFLGMQLDPVETYEWGWEELARIRTEMRQVGRTIVADADIADVVDFLERDPTRAAPDHAAFVRFVEDRQRAAVVDLDGTHFDVPAPVRNVTVNVAPPGNPPGAYYFPPSEDFSRPGSIWYSLSPEDGPVPLYQEVATAYHEGFPGHHLQVGVVLSLAEHLSRFHRLVIWYSGYGEGWALYAERLMQELGYFERPEYVFGMLASHAFRAARVVVDIGCHLGLTIPDSAPMHAGETWNHDIAVEYMNRIGLQSERMAKSEVLRYLGWPGQAISYKVGEREILGLRAIREARPGFDLKQFHREILGHGGVRLDLLRRVVLEGWE